MAGDPTFRMDRAKSRQGKAGHPSGIASIAAFETFNILRYRGCAGFLVRAPACDLSYRDRTVLLRQVHAAQQFLKSRMPRSGSNRGSTPIRQSNRAVAITTFQPRHCIVFVAKHGINRSHVHAAKYIDSPATKPGVASPARSAAIAYALDLRHQRRDRCRCLGSRDNQFRKVHSGKPKREKGRATRPRL